MHPDEEYLADLAIGEPDTASAARHVDSCSECTAVVVELRAVEDLLRSTSKEHLSEPSPELWHRIARATFAPDSVEDAAGHGTADDTARYGIAVQTAELPETAETGGDTDVTGDASSAVSTVADISRPRRGGSTHRSLRPWLAGVAAAASLVVGVALGQWWPTDDGSAESLVASTSLHTLDEAGQSLGEADVVRGASGEYLLKVNTSAFQRDPQGYVEVWLINADGKRMISVGTLAEDATTLPIPSEALDQGYRIVDVSREQYDDKPAHSGDSVMRGTLAV